jgi:hypothetical protein
LLILSKYIGFALAVLFKTAPWSVDHFPEITLPVPGGPINATPTAQAREVTGSVARLPAVRCTGIRP